MKSDETGIRLRHCCPEEGVKGQPRCKHFMSYYQIYDYSEAEVEEKKQVTTWRERVVCMCLLLVAKIFAGDMGEEVKSDIERLRTAIYVS